MIKCIAFVFCLFYSTSIVSQVTFNSSEEVVSYLTSSEKWFPVETCGGFTSKPCEPIPIESQNYRIEFSKVLVQLPDGTSVFASDSVDMSFYYKDTLNHGGTAYVSLFSPGNSDNWLLDFSDLWYDEVIETSYMEEGATLALEKDGSDTPTIIFQKNKPTSSTDLQIINEAVQVYPNPVESLLTLDISSGKPKGAVSIIDSQGRIVTTITVNENKIDVSNLNSGLYYVKLVDGNKIYHSRFLKM